MTKLHGSVATCLTLVLLCLGLGGCGGGAPSSGPSPQSNPKPVVASISPAAAPVGTSSQTLTLDGTGFLESSTITFNGSPHKITFTSSQQLSISLDKTDLAKIGNFAVVVTNPSPGGGQSAQVNFRVQGGTLQVQISGLPGGTVGNVTVSSTSGFSVTITSSQNLQLPPASYSVDAGAAPAGNVNYYASPAVQSVGVTDGSSNSIQVPYNTATPTTTKVLDQAGSESLLASSDGSTLTMSSSSTVAQSLAPGDILAIGVTPSTPRGLLRKIVSVSQSGSMIVATTTQGTLAETFQEANFSFQGTLGPQTFQKAQVLRQGVKVLRINRQKSLQQAPSSSTSLSDPCAANLATFVQLINVPIVQDSSGSITATGQIEVCPSLQFNWSIGGFPPQLNSLTATAKLGSDVHVNVTGRYDNSFTTSVPILQLETADPVTVFVGPVPIVIFPELTFFVGASGDVTVGFSTGVTQTATTTAGISYNNGQVSPIFNSTSNFGTDPFGIDGAFSAKGFAGVTLDLKIDDVISPEFSPDGFLNLGVNPTQNPWWTLTGGLEGSGSVSVSIFGFANLANFEFPNLFQFSKTITQASGGFLTSDAAPTLSVVQPNVAPLDSPDFALALTGTNFVPGATVSFNGAALPTTFKDPNDLNATLGSAELATAGTFPVSVTNPDTPGATSSSLNFTVSTSVGNPIPLITSLSPNSATVGSSGETLAINGQNFLSTSTVTYNGVSHTPSYVSSSQLTIALSPSDLAVAGSYPVVGTNPGPGGGPSNAVEFAVGNPVPTISSLSPGSVAAGSPAQALKINGSNFLGSSTVSFNGATRTTTFVSSTQLTISLTAADLATTGTFPVSVTNPTPGGGTSNASDFTVLSGTPGSVTLSPTSVTVPEGGAQTFTASVVGNTTGVTWTIQEGSSGGTIVNSTTSTAIYVPPSATGTFHIVATNADDSSQTSVATVTVTSPITLTVLHTFQPSQGDGLDPVGSLIQGSDGNFYGTTHAGGPSDAGTIFKIDTSGNFDVLYSFTGSDGSGSDAGLIQATDGNLYGTTFYGGASGRGTAFKTDTLGDVTFLHSFVEPSAANPFAGLIQASDGSFYGTSYYGGPTDAGTAFKMDASGNVTVLHSFSGPDGSTLYSGLIQATNGDFYGTAYYGGASGGTGGGTVYKMDASGTVTVVHSFSGSDGTQPFAGLVQGSDGNLYGTTVGGGAYGNGTVFKVGASGVFTVVHSFSGTDGSNPYAGLIQGSDGNYYGTTSGGGPLGQGTIFRMDPKGNVTVLHSFSNSDAGYVTTGVIQGNDGNLYGTGQGGSAGSGVIYRLDLSSSTSP